MLESTLSAIMHSEVPWLTLLALVVSGLLLRFRPGERKVFLNTLWLFLVGVAGQAAAWALDLLAVPGASTVVYTVFRIVAAIALIRLLGFALFRLLMPLARREPPRIIEDLAIVAVYVVYAFAQLRGAGVDLSSIVTT